LILSPRRHISYPCRGGVAIVTLNHSGHRRRDDNCNPLIEKSFYLGAIRRKCLVAKDSPQYVRTIGIQLLTETAFSQGLAANFPPSRHCQKFAIIPGAERLSAESRRTSVASLQHGRARRSGRNRQSGRHETAVKQQWSPIHAGSNPAGFGCKPLAVPHKWHRSRPAPPHCPRTSP